jgi:excisionase family DNA binding protein
VAIAGRRRGPLGAVFVSDASKYLRPSEVAEKLGVSRQQIDKWLKAGRIPFVWFGPERRIKPSDARKPAELRPGRKKAPS